MMRWRALRVAAMFAIAVSSAGMSTMPSAAVGNFQGLWWKAPAGSESGWGINFAHQGDVIFATWFTYDATGKALWLSMTADKTAEGVYAGALYQTRGPAFSAVPFDPAAVTATQVGSGTLTFSDDSNGTFAYTVNGIAQSKPITRQVFGAVPTCVFGTLPDLTFTSNYQDLWWAAPAGNESGWGVNFTHQGDTIFATWFTYDSDGTPLWLSATLPMTGVGTFSGELYRTTGPAFNAVPFLPANVALTAVGTLMLTFTDGNSGSFAYTVNGVTQIKSITRQVFRTPGTACQYAEGVWTGTTSRGETAHAIVIDGGTFYVFYSKPGSAVDGGVVQGTAQMDGGQISSADGVDYPVAQSDETSDVASPAAVAGSYTPRTELQLSFTGGTARTLSATFLPGAEQPASLADVAGNYVGISGHVGGRRPGTRFSVDASGNITGANDICVFAGTLTPRRTGNVFDFTLRDTSVALCVFGRGPLAGTAYYDATTRQFHGFAPFSARQDMYYLIGTKP